MNTKLIQSYMRQPWRLAVLLKRLGLLALFVGVVSAVTYWAVDNLRDYQHIIISLTILWLLAAYIFLPRFHRFFTSIYVPDYFIGRARTSDGLLADPVNLAIIGSQASLAEAMARAGWQVADPITIKTVLQTIIANLQRRKYPNAPVSDLYVYGRRQDLAFQKAVDDNPAKRHHVRFWRVDDNIYLPGGHKVDFVAAATYDDAVGFSFYTLQFTHRIDGEVDDERDFVADSLVGNKSGATQRRINHFFPSYRHRNGGGDSFFTDGSMVIVNLPLFKKVSGQTRRRKLKQ